METGVQTCALPICYVLGNYAKDEMDDVAGMLGAVSAEARWLAEGNDARFMSEIALRQQDEG